MNVRLLFVVVPGLCATAELAKASPAQAPVLVLSPAFRAAQGKLQLAPPAPAPKPRRFWILPGKPDVVAVTPGAATPDTGVCSVPLTNVLRGRPPSPPMPVIPPRPQRFPMREARLPAPPCGEKQP